LEERSFFFFFIILGLWVSKDAEFNVDVKNINLPKWQNAPKKSYSRKTNFLYTVCGKKVGLTL
jgi:hypothetical protein